MENAVKVKLKEAEKKKRELIKQGTIDFSFKPKKEGEFIYFPVKEHGNTSMRFESEKKEDLNSLLSKYLTKKELGAFPNSFDCIGDILIVELPKELFKKENAIGTCLLRFFKHIKVVARKAGFHGGTFRTRKLKIIAGEKRKETLYRENGVVMKVNVETCYFSERLSHERLRIAHQVKPDEEVMVMFSGVAPYPLAISKNSRARWIYAIEMNPLAHTFARENVSLNKMNNIFLFEGDVRKMMKETTNALIGLKSHYQRSQLDKRLAKKPKLIELHLFMEDMYEKLKDLETAIKNIRKQGIQIMLHQPLGICYSTSNKEEQARVFEIYHRLYALCKKYGLIGFIAHPFGMEEGILPQFASDMKDLKIFEDYMYPEYVPTDKTEYYFGVLRKLKFPKMCIDISHFYLAERSTEKLYATIKKAKEHHLCYFHINDAHLSGKGHKDSYEIGKGSINFPKIAGLLDFGVTEVISKDENHPIEMLGSYERLRKMRTSLHLFDRIVMPLPKTAEDFLDLALAHLKPGGTIHLYDFLKEEDIPQKAIEKIKKHCAPHILQVVKCGQYSPKKFRICIDFKIK